MFLYGTSVTLATRCRQKWLLNVALGIRMQSIKRARPTSKPPASLSAKCIQPRRAVLQPRISQSFSQVRILSSQCFFTTRAILADCFKLLRLAISACPTLPFALGFPLDRAPLLLAFFIKQTEHSVDRAVFALRPQSYLQLGSAAFVNASTGVAHRVRTGFSSLFPCIGTRGPRFPIDTALSAGAGLLCSQSTMTNMKPLYEKS